MLDEFESIIIDRETSFDIEFEIEKSDANYIVFKFEYLDGIAIEPGYYWGIEHVTSAVLFIEDDYKYNQYTTGSL